VAYAAKEGTTADDGVGRNHSPFTEALLKHIATPGLEVDYLFRLVRDDVLDATDRQQMPNHYNGLGREKIYLVPPPKTAALDPQIVSPPQPVVAPLAMAPPATLVSPAEIGSEKRSLPFTVFKDCESCPDMVIVAPGEFLMGSPESEPGRRSTEGPLHKVSLAAPFAIGRYAITRDQFNTFVAASGYRYGESCRAEKAGQWIDIPKHSFLSPPGFTQEGNHPAVCINWTDANEYLKWLSARTHKSYRLPTEAEREYVTRAGTSTGYWWGEAVEPQQGNYDTRLRLSPPEETALAKFFGHTVPVHWYMPNQWGIFQVHGNVAEWVQDCWNKTHIGGPIDGSAAQTGDCSRRVVRGGAWNYFPEDIRAAYRESAPAEHRYYHVGFRVARDLGK
jgi:formylglycine-generating enzyme required for sulfatase activity